MPPPPDCFSGYGFYQISLLKGMKKPRRDDAKIGRSEARRSGQEKK